MRAGHSRDPIDGRRPRALDQRQVIVILSSGETGIPVSRLDLESSFRRHATVWFARSVLGNAKISPPSFPDQGLR